MGTQKKDDFSFEILDHIKVLSTNEKGWSKELNLIKWGDNAPKYDIRDWNEDHTKMGKGITLTKDEVKALIEVHI